MNTVYFAILALLSVAAIIVFGFMLYSKFAYKATVNLREDWRGFYKWWSTWLTAIGAALGSFLVAVPDTANAVWLAMPEEIKQRLPENFLLWVPLGIFIAAQIVKVFKQSKPN